MRHVFLRFARMGFALGCATVLITGPAVLDAQTADVLLRHKDVKERLRLLGGSKKIEVTVEGRVDNLVDVPEGSPRAYHLRDDRGTLLLVRTTNSLPEVNALLRIKGVAMIDREPPFLNTPYLFEQVRTVQKEKPTPGVITRETPATTSTTVTEPQSAGGSPTETTLGPERTSTTGGSKGASPGGGATGPSPNPDVKGPGPTTTDASHTPWYRGNALYFALALGASLLVGGLVFIVARRNGHQPPQPWVNPYATPQGPTVDDVLLRGGPIPAPSADAPTVQDFKTVKAYKTTKVLPGRLIILDDGRETDVIHLSDQSGRGEIEIGRDSPDATGGIRIKDDTNTLSRHQAKLSYDSAKHEFRLLNLVGESGNPTVINGRMMHANEAIVLKDDDVIAMGSVELKFKQR